MSRYIMSHRSTKRTIKLGGVLSVIAIAALATPGCFLFSYDTRGVDVLNEDAKTVKVVREAKDVESCQPVATDHCKIPMPGQGGWCSKNMDLKCTVDTDCQQVRRVAVGHMNQNDLIEGVYNAVKNEAAGHGANTVLVKTDPPANAAGWFAGDTSDSDRKNLDAFFEACDSTSQCYGEENASWDMYCTTTKPNRCDQAANPADGTNIGGLRYTITALAYKCN